MSQSVRDFEKSLECSEDLSEKQFFIVQQDANGKVGVAEGATDLLLGVLQNNPASGEMATYRFGGTTKVKAGGTIAIGDWITAASDGEAVATTTDGDIVIGKALQAGVDQDVIEVQLHIHHLYIA
jgi:hypothetical protein